MEKNNRMFMDYVLLYTSDPSDPPPLWPICIGHENNRSHSAYNWDNSVRKLDFPTRTVQYTISGKGAFTDSMGKEHTVGADDILFLMEPSPQRYSLPADSDFWEVLFISFRGELAFQLFEQLTKQYGELVHFDENNEFLKTLQEFRLVAKESERMHSDAYFASGFAYSFFMTLFFRTADESPEFARILFPADQNHFLLQQTHFLQNQCRRHGALRRYEPFPFFENLQETSGDFPGTVSIQSQDDSCENPSRNKNAAQGNLSHLRI